jgi:NADPH-dependent 2,4-dienoyl-CoA reductase/sulfur reductase-like enzyme
MRSIAIVGASLAGLSAARALRAEGFEGRLTIIGDEPYRPYDRPPLSKDFLAGRMADTDLTLEADDEDLGAEWRLAVRATGLVAGERRVLLDDGGSVQADGIVIATGAAARPLPGTETANGPASEAARGTGAAAFGVHTLRSLDDARALRADLVAGRRLVVIGAGFIGAEVASTARELGLDVVVVETAGVPFLRALGAEMGAALGALHGDHGVRLICGVGVRAISGRSRVDGVLLDDGRRLPADVVLVGIGARPNVEWLVGSGVELSDGVLCDAGGATSVPGIVAVGDCAAWFDPAVGRHHRVEHWTGALQRPKAAAVTLLSGGTALPDPPRPPYFWSDQYKSKIQFIGHVRPGDTVSVLEGDVADRSFLAVYRRDDRPVAVLGVNQVRQFTRWRRQLDAVTTR